MISTSFVALPAVGLTVAVHEAGDPAGPPVFLLHGNSLSASSFERQLMAFELRQFRLVALDLPGHGQSPNAPGHYTIGGMKDVVVAVVLALGLANALAVGHSYGGHLLLEALPELPALRGLLAIGAPPVSTDADFQAAFRFDETALLFYAPSLSPSQVQALARFCLRPGAPAAEVAPLAAALARADGQARTALAASIAAGGLAAEVGYVAHTAVPLALAAGEYDTALNFAYFDALTAPSRWEKPLHQIPAAGHTPFLENPAAFNQLLLRFLAATGPAH